MLAKSKQAKKLNLSCLGRLDYLLVVVLLVIRVFYKKLLPGLSIIVGSNSQLVVKKQLFFGDISIRGHLYIT